MNHTTPSGRIASVFAIAVAFVFVVTVEANAQGGGGRGQLQPPPTARVAAPIDLTGYWVSVVTEDWRWRMVTPPKGDYPSIPLNAEGRRVANAWDPAKDEAEGNQCKAYGAGNIMRIPGRLHITWQDDNTLRIDTDAGMQTRLFHFDASRQRSGERTWQGFSVAEWEFPGGARGKGPGGYLTVVTTGMRSGYLQKNGPPYSENAVVTEDFHIAMEPDRAWLFVTTLVDDPQYLAAAPKGAVGDRYGPFIRSTAFKREPDGSKWNPTPCSAR